MRLRDAKDGCDYIYTHIDNFKLVAKDADSWLQKISHTFLVKSHGPRSYYLVNNYTYREDLDVWTYGGREYTRDAIGRVERIYGCLTKVSTPLPVTDFHPDLNESLLLGLDDHRKFQMLLEMLQWLVMICRLDICHVASSLNRFGSCPRETHLDFSIRAFVYLKQVPDPQICIDYRPVLFNRTKTECHRENIFS